MRLAFHQFGNDFWAAGNWFIDGMFHALRCLGADCPALILVVDERTPAADYAPLAAMADEMLRAPEPPPDAGLRLQESLRYHSLWWLRHRLLRQPAPRRPHPLAAVLAQQQLEGYFTLARNPAPICSVPSLVWIPDMQHVRLPANFTPEERQVRSRDYQAQLGWATFAVVTSDEVRRDLAALAPSQAGKLRLIHYVADVPADLYQEHPWTRLAAYHLPEKFIYLPNQFWQHKNHGLVFEALARLAERQVRPVIVSTGNTFDYRRPAYFAELMQTLSRLNIREQVIILGQVARADVYHLIRQSICVLNPSRFEGLGLSVAESISIGKRVLVSDLPPLREQDAPGVVYFDPDQAGDLADKLEQAWTTLAPGPDERLEEAARSALPGRQTAFGRQLLGLFEEARLEFSHQSQ